MGEHMQSVRTGVLIGLALTATGLALAQAGRDAPNVEIVVKGKPGGQNMVCTLGGKPCSGNVVRQLSAEASKHGVMVALAGSDGSLRCTTRERRECMDDAVAVVLAVARVVSAKGIRN